MNREIGSYFIHMYWVLLAIPSTVSLSDSNPIPSPPASPNPTLGQTWSALRKYDNPALARLTDNTSHMYPRAMNTPVLEIEPSSSPLDEP